MNTDTEWLSLPAAGPDEDAAAAATHRQTQLTKPPGSLGRLETEVIRLAGMQGRACPRVDQVHIAVFAGDHGVATKGGVSAFPQAVTAEMIKNFARGGAAISVLAAQLGARLQVVNLGTVFPVGFDRAEQNPVDVQTLELGRGTADFREQAAMTEYQLARAFHAGRQITEGARLAGAELFIGGEMGIGNTTSATALSCALLDRRAADLVGPGTGLDGAGVARKTAVIDEALCRHAASRGDATESLRCLGGFEIAALTGAYLACAHMGLPVLVDGFICTAAALTAVQLCPGARDWMIFAHGSAEPGHRLLLDALGAEPLLDLGLRLGEASGAASAVPLLRLACATHEHMATFAEAGVSTG